LGSKQNHRSLKKEEGSFLILWSFSKQWKYSSNIRQYTFEVWIRNLTKRNQSPYIIFSYGSQKYLIY
jgi:hypothetical protein